MFATAQVNVVCFIVIGCGAVECNKILPLWLAQFMTWYNVLVNALHMQLVLLKVRLIIQMNTDSSWKI